MKKTLFLYNKIIPVFMNDEIISEARQRLHINLCLKNIFFVVCEFRNESAFSVHDLGLAYIIDVVMVDADAVYADKISLVFYRSRRKQSVPDI